MKKGKNVAAMLPKADKEPRLDLNLGVALTVFQLLLLFQTARLSKLGGDFEFVVKAHSLQASPTNHLNRTSCSEIDWLERAQARALERLGLVVPNPEHTRWTLTPGGELKMRWYRMLLMDQLPRE